ncbi:MAG: DegQ family serine endoprotease [Thermodesulfobacteriota bacterium]
MAVQAAEDIESPGSFSRLAEDAAQSVVNISAVRERRMGAMPFEMPFGQQDPFKDFFEWFFRDQMPKEHRQKSLGSGFVIDKEGLILTNNHVVEKAEEISVTLSDESEFPATIVGRDPKTDLALIRIESDHPLTPLPFGDSDQLEVGDWVVAIGNPFGLGNTVTAGIVSAKGRIIGAGPYDDFIQTDVSINPGNSGGPLLNTAGKVIGINTAIFSRSGGNIGIGFAIPVTMAKDLLPQLKEGKVVRGWIGVMIQEITPELMDKFDLKKEKGALVANVTSGGPADEAGIKRGDVIVSFAGKEIEKMKELPYVVASTSIGETVPIEVIRNGKRKTLEVTIKELEQEEEEPRARETSDDLGIRLREITPELAKTYGLPETSGLLVVQVRNNTPADEAGLRQNDIIVEVEQTRVTDLETFNQIVGRHEKGDTILFLVNRQGRTLYLTVEVW